MRSGGGESVQAIGVHGCERRDKRGELSELVSAVVAVVEMCSQVCCVMAEGVVAELLAQDAMFLAVHGFTPISSIADLSARSA